MSGATRLIMQGDKVHIMDMLHGDMFDRLLLAKIG